jgi:hypothetical protein
MKTKFALSIIILMMASYANAFEMTTTIEMGPFLFTFNSDILGNDISLWEGPVVENLTGRGRQETYFATAFNDTVYFKLIKDEYLSCPPVENQTQLQRLLDSFLSTGAKKELLDLGVNKDSIRIYPRTIDGNQTIVSTGFISAENSTDNYQLIFHPDANMNTHIGYDTGYNTANNSTEYQARFYISPGDTGVVGSGNQARQYISPGYIGVVGSGNEELFNSILRSIKVTEPNKKQECETLDFDIKICEVYWYQCKNGSFDVWFKVAGLEVYGGHFHGVLPIKKMQKFPRETFHLGCGSFGLGGFEKFEYCLYGRNLTIWMASTLDSIFHKEIKLKNLTIKRFEPAPRKESTERRSYVMK